MFAASTVGWVIQSICRSYNGKSSISTHTQHERGEEEEKKKKAHIKIIEWENNSQRNELLESERLKQTACISPFCSFDVIQYWADRWAHISILKRFLLFFCARSYNKFMESNLICVGTCSCHKTQTHTSGAACRWGWNWKLRSAGMCHVRLPTAEVWRRMEMQI